MSKLTFVSLLLVCAIGLSVRDASAQVFEAVGSRALGMGGAFVAVASDSSATWWNPAGPAAGPFVDVAWARAVTEAHDTLAPRRDRAAWFALTTPPFGFSYYRLRVIDIRVADPIGAGIGDRESRQVVVPVRSWSASQLGVTLVQTLTRGVHVGATLKYVRGTLRSDVDMSGTVSERLDRAEALTGGSAEGRLDADVGVLAVAGPVRLGGVVRNLREPEFGGSAFKIPRQARVGAAFDGEDVVGTPLTIAVDADVRRYPSSTGDRRVVALGAEEWLMGRRFGVRGGGRFNTIGAKERSATAGISVSLRSGFFVDGHVVRGGSSADRGWGLAARTSF